jgi:hypothetical protein
MARTRSIPAGTYPAGTYGPFSVDQFTRDDAEWLEVVVPTAGWPTTPGVAIARVTLTWDAGGGGSALFQSNPTGRGGAPLAFVSLSVSIPRTASGKKAVMGGEALVEVLVPSLTLAAGGIVQAV